MFEVREAVMDPAGSLPALSVFKQLTLVQLKSLAEEYTSFKYLGGSWDTKAKLIQHLLKAIASVANPTANINESYQPKMNCREYIEKVNCWQCNPEGPTTPHQSCPLPAAISAQASPPKE